MLADFCLSLRGMGNENATMIMLEITRSICQTTLNRSVSSLMIRMFFRIKPLSNHHVQISNMTFDP